MAEMMYLDVDLTRLRAKKDMCKYVYRYNILVEIHVLLYLLGSEVI